MFYERGPIVNRSIQLNRNIQAYRRVTFLFDSIIIKKNVCCWSYFHPGHPFQPCSHHEQLRVGFLCIWENSIVTITYLPENDIFVAIQPFFNLRNSPNYGLTISQNNHMWNVGLLLRDYTVQYIRRLSSSAFSFQFSVTGIQTFQIPPPPSCKLHV